MVVSIHKDYWWIEISKDMQGVDLVGILFDCRSSDVVLIFDTLSINNTLNEYSEYLDLDSVVATWII